MKVVNRTPHPFAPLVSRTGPTTYQATFALKGTFELRPGEPATPAPKQPPFAADRYDDDDNTRECLYALDLAPFKPKADLLLSGACHPPGDGPATVCRVTFGVGGWSKSLVAIGDRTSKSGLMVDQVSNPVPFASMPIRYTRSYGAPDWTPNPVGTGRGLPKLPNIEASEAAAAALEPDRPPAGYGPISRAWIPRSAKVGRGGKDYLKTRWPGPPADFDPVYHNAAPTDQQVPYLRGDEELRLLHLVAGTADWRGKLPGLRVRCVARRKDGDVFKLREIGLNLDTLHVDAEQRTLTLVWRGVIDTATEDVPEAPEILIVTEPLATPAAPPETLLPLFDKPKKAEPAPIPPPPPADPEALSPSQIELMAEKQEEDALNQMRDAGTLAGVDVAALIEQGAPPASIAEAHEALVRARETLVEAGQAIPPGLDEQIAETEPGGELDLAVTDIASRGAPAKPLTREDVIQGLARGESFARRDLSGLNLSGLDFTRVDLTRSLLKRTDLSKAKLVGAKLPGAQMSKATLRGADLESADLQDCDATDATFAGANLERADLRGAQFNRAILAEAKLSHANAVRASFHRADLSKTVFRKAILDQAELGGAVLDQANFSRASLQGASLRGAKGSSVALDNATLKNLCALGAELPGATLTDAAGEGSIWQGAKLEGADFTNAGLVRAQFPAAVLRKASFFRADLRKASFRGADLAEARLQQANLMNATFEKASLLKTSFVRSNLYEVQLLDAALDGADFDKANVAGTVLAL